MSRSFVDHLWGNTEPLGAHPVDGFVEPVAVFRPAQ
jgi:adenylate cyclase